MRFNNTFQSPQCSGVKAQSSRKCKTLIFIYFDILKRYVTSAKSCQRTRRQTAALMMMYPPDSLQAQTTTKIHLWPLLLSSSQTFAWLTLLTLLRTENCIHTLLEHSPAATGWGSQEKPVRQLFLIWQTPWWIFTITVWSLLVHFKLSNWWKQPRCISDLCFIEKCPKYFVFCVSLKLTKIV